MDLMICKWVSGCENSSLRSGQPPSDTPAPGRIHGRLRPAGCGCRCSKGVKPKPPPTVVVPKPSSLSKTKLQFLAKFMFFLAGPCSEFKCFFEHQQNLV